jgi:hypothetical protein
MPDALLLVPAFVLAGVLVWSGIAKLRHPDDLAGWGRLGVPAALRRSWLLRLHPWAELALALALITLGGVLGALAALACLALMGAYLWLVARALRAARGAAEDATCACFGEDAPISTVTVVRNVWLVLLSALAVTGLAAAPLLGGAVAGATQAGAWPWILGAAVAAATVVLVRWPEHATSAGPEMQGSTVAGDSMVNGRVTGTRGEDAELDYVRTRTPAVPVQLADGTTVDLRTLAAQKPLLILAVSTTCGACLPVIEAAPGWRELVPEVDIRLLLQHAPAEGAFAERDEPQSLHDPHDYVRRSIEEWGTPTALLLGADGMLAGGPVTGDAAVERFVADIRASLDEIVASPTAPAAGGAPH